MSIELRDLHKAFGPKKVLQGFTLRIEEGETLSIIGGSGAGKSVTLKHILGLVTPDQGEVWVDGQNVNELARSQVPLNGARGANRSLGRIHPLSERAQHVVAGGAGVDEAAGAPQRALEAVELGPDALVALVARLAFVLREAGAHAEEAEPKDARPVMARLSQALEHLDAQVSFVGRAVGVDA